MAPKSKDDEDEETAVAISSELLKDGNSGRKSAGGIFQAVQAFLVIHHLLQSPNDWVGRFGSVSI